MNVGTRALFWGGAFSFFIGFVWVFSGVLTPFVLGISIAYLLDPLVRRFCVMSRLPRWIVALLMVCAFFLFLGCVLLVSLPLVFRQGQMLIEQSPAYLQTLLDYSRPYFSWIQEKMGAGQDPMEYLKTYLSSHVGKLVGITGGLAAGIATGGRVLADFFTTLLITPLVAFFMMKEWPQIVRWVEGLYPRRHTALIRSLLGRIDLKLSGFIRGQITVAFILGVFYAFALTFAGLNYGFLIGLGAGLFSIIPLVGSTIGLLAAVLIAFLQVGGDLSYLAIICAIFFGGQFLEGNFLSPKLVGDSVGLHPLWIMFAIFSGGSLFGVVGMLLAVPVTASVGVLLGFVIERYKESSLYQDESYQIEKKEPQSFPQEGA